MQYSNFPENTRKAELTDLPEVSALFKRAIAHMIDNGIFQWDDIYPDAEALQTDIERGEMYLYTINARIMSTFTINQFFDPEYADGNWKYSARSAASIHRLCVNPNYQNSGVGTKTVCAAENILQNGGIKSVRLDAFSQNPAALRLYEKLEYANVGIAHFRKGLFYLYEKAL